MSPPSPVFGVNLDSFLVFEGRHQLSQAFEAPEGNSERMSEKEKGRGSLFGSLIHRRIDTDSYLYQEAALELSLPELGDLPRELFEEEASLGNGQGAHTGVNTHLLTNVDDGGEEVESPKEDGDSARELERCAYFSEAAKEEASDALYTSSWRDIAFKGNDVIDLTLLALQGVESEFYGKGAIQKFALAGYSMKSLHRYTIMHMCLFVLRRVLGASAEDYSSSPDPSLCAFGRVLAEVLHIHDASIVALRKKYVVRHQGSSGIPPCADNMAILLDIWRSTHSQRSLLWFLLPVVATDDLTASLVSAAEKSSALSHFPEERESEGDSGQVEGVLPADILQELTAVMDAQGKAWNFLQPGAGWLLLDHLYGKMSISKSLCDGVKYPSVFDSVGSHHFHSENTVSTPFVHLVVTTCMVRRVSRPLLWQVDKVLFRLDLGFVETVDEAELNDTLPFSVGALLRTHGGSPVSEVLMALLWARGRVALLSSRQDPAGHFKAADGCLDEDTQLVFPLNEKDIFDLAGALSRAQRRLDTMRRYVQDQVHQWVSQSRHELPPEMRDTVREWTASSASNRTERAREAPIARKTLDEMNKSLPQEPETPPRTARSAQKREEAEQRRKEEVGSASEFTSPLGIAQNLDKSLVEAAKEQILERYRRLGLDSETRAEAARWASERVTSVPKSREALNELLLEDMKGWSESLEYKIQSSDLERLSLRPAPAAESNSSEAVVDGADSDSSASTVGSAPSTPSRQLKDHSGSVSGAIAAAAPRSPIKERVMVAVRQSVGDILSAVIDEAVYEVTDQQAGYATHGDDGKSVSASVIHVHQAPGGASTVDLGQEGHQDDPDVMQASTRVNQAPGGASSLDLSLRSSKGVSELPLHSTVTVTGTEVVVEEGQVREELSSETETQAKSKPEIEFVVITEQEQEQEQEINVTFEAVADESVDSSSEVSLGAAGGLVKSEDTGQPHRGLTHPEADCFRREDELYAATGSFPGAIKLLARSHGLLAGGPDDKEEDRDEELDFSLLLRPAEESPRTALRAAIMQQCAVLDQATLYLSIQSKALLHHVDCIDAAFLCSDRSDFLVSLSACVVEAFQERHQRNGRFGHHRGALSETVWSEGVLKRGLSKARRLCVMGSKEHLDRASFDIKLHPPSTTIPTADAVDTSVFSADGLQHLEISYDAPWPVSAMYSAQRVRRVGGATRRLLAVGHATVLVRMVWAELRSAEVSANRRKLGEYSPAVMRGLYNAFRSVQVTVQAVEAFSSHRVRIAQERLRSDIAANSAEHGCAGVIEAIERYTQSLFCGLFIISDEEHSQPTDPSFEIIGMLIEELLHASRSVLRGIFDVMSVGMQRALAEGVIERLNTAILEHSRVKRALARTSGATGVAGLEDADLLTMYL